MPFSSERLDPERHDLSGFTCGEPLLDGWLREQATGSTARRTARTWVWSDCDERVVGYYALSAHKVAREDVPAKIGRGGPTEIPSVLLGRLALAQSLQGQGLGAVLVADALTRVVEATRTVGARLVVVDALHEPVAKFYESLGFRRVPHSLILVQKLTDIEAALHAG